jgi:hypothetical protein
LVPADPGDHEAFYMQFAYYPSEQRFHPAYLGGITRGSEVPSGAAAGKNLRVWDFRKCDSAEVNSWRFENTGHSCQPGNGLQLDPVNEDPLMVSPDLTKPDVVRLDPAARYLRLRVAAVYPQGRAPNRVDWFWKTATQPFGESRRMGVPMREGGTPYTYWMLAPYTSKEGVREAITQLRYDPAIGKVPSQILWIAVDTVE